MRSAGGRPVKSASGLSSGLDYLHWKGHKKDIIKKDINCYSASLTAAESLDGIEVLIGFCLCSSTLTCLILWRCLLVAQNWKYILKIYKYIL